MQYDQEPTASRFVRFHRARLQQHGVREPRPQRGPVNSEVALALAVAWSALRFRTAAVFVVPCGLPPLDEHGGGHAGGGQ